MSNSGENKPVIPILTGPTGAGKTGVALSLLEIHPDIQVISADSRQIYKHLNIGTDKPPGDILKKYNFHLVDFVRPGERYTAFDFVRDANKIIEDTLSEGGVPLICGGTGLYIRSLVEGIVEIEDDFDVRERLENDTIEKGPQYLYEKLQEIDPEEAAKVHPHNIKKIIRALEIFHIAGKTKTELLSSGPINDSHRFEIVCLMPPRDILYEKINRRVDQMMEAGLLEEVRTICGDGLKGIVEEINVIGYTEVIKHIDAIIDKETAINLIKQNSRRYAKRQITWFGGMENISYADSGEKILKLLKPFWQ